MHSLYRSDILVTTDTRPSLESGVWIFHDSRSRKQTKRSRSRDFEVWAIGIRIAFLLDVFPKGRILCILNHGPHPMKVLKKKSHPFFPNLLIGRMDLCLNFWVNSALQ